MTVAAWEDDEEVAMPDIMEAIKPTLVAHFKPALLARMTMVPFLPISPDAMAMITRLKLNKLMKRLKTSQNLNANYTPQVVDLIASRCTEVDTAPATSTTSCAPPSSAAVELHSRADDHGRPAGERHRRCGRW